MKRIWTNSHHRLASRIHHRCCAKGRPVILGRLGNHNDVGDTKLPQQHSYNSYGFYGKRRFLSSDSNEHSNNSDDKNPCTVHNMKLYNTMTECLESLPSADSVVPDTDPTSPSSSSSASQKNKGMIWYTCGPTVYAPSHLGHARTYVCLDILRRVMMASNSRQANSTAPLFVLNITDVDDKILAAAAADGGSDPVRLARKYEREFWRDLDALNCLRPNIVTRVTEHVDSHIVPFIERLVEKGMAYELKVKEEEGQGQGLDGDVDGVYFDVLAYNELMGLLTKYGKLAPPSAAHGMEDILGNNNNANDNHHEKSARQKRDPRDFVLWKKRKGQEALHWSSPWGDGRPGWHIECSAMIEAISERFQDSHQFLVHAGGIDLKFPHHTNEIAQSEAYSGRGEWIPHWVHTGHLHIDGLKMSKSLKNFVSIEDFLNNYNSSDITKATNALESPADDFRLWCLGLSGSYRGPATFSTSRIKEARSVRQKILRFLLDGETWIRSNEKEEELSTKVLHDEECELFKVTDGAKRRSLSALENDLDGSTFVSELLVIVECGMKYINKKNRGPVEPLISSIGEIRNLLRLVGFTDATTEAGSQTGNSNSHSNSKICEDTLIEALVQFRSTVRNIALDEPEISEGMKKVLALSDELRDSILPEVGVQLIDSNDREIEDNWKYCLPRTPLPDRKKSNIINDTSSSSNGSSDLTSIPLIDFFRVGQYEGIFSLYTEDGIPTHNADDSEVSKRSLKKLLKKRENHRERLDKNSQ